MIEMYIYLLFVGLSLIVSVFTWSWIKKTEAQPVPFKFKTAMVVAAFVPVINALFSLLFIYVLISELMS